MNLPRWGRWRKVLASLVFGAVAVCLAVFLWLKLEPVVRGCKSVSSAGYATKVIFHSGRYCLLSDLNWDKTGAPIIISKSNITLDLKGYTIRGNKEKLDQIGILLSDGITGVTIENGYIESVQVGIRAKEVRDVRISGVTFNSISWFGVHLNGAANSIANSKFTDIGVRDDGGEGDAYAVGIMAAGENFVLENNLFENVRRQPVPKDQTGEGVAIIVSENSSNFKIKNNNFVNTTDWLVDDLGIWVRGKGVSIESNNFSSLRRPIGGKFDEVNYIINNKIIVDNKFQSDDGALKKHAAVSVNMSDSSLLVIKNNSFSGYSCPVQVFSEIPKHLVLEDKNNIAVWPAGGKSCLSGVWRSDVINWPKPPK